MAALVQTIPQQSGTVPVLQTRPSSSSGTFASPSQATATTQFQNMSWASFNTANQGSYGTGHQVVAPYAFAPNLNQSANAQQNRQSWSPHLRPEHRTFSAPTIQGAQSGANPRVSHTAAGSVSTSSSSNSSFRSHGSKDDSALPSRQPRADQPLRPLSTANLPPPPTVMTLSSPAGTVKPSPNRYRRSNQRSQSPAPAQAPASVSSSSSTSPPIVTVTSEESSSPKPVRPALRSSGHTRFSSVDDSSHAERPQPELAKRYRRRSMGTMDPSSYPNLNLQLPPSPSPTSGSGSYDFINFDTNSRPRSAHSHQGSNASNHSTHSSTSSVGTHRMRQQFTSTLPPIQTKTSHANMNLLLGA